MARLVGCTVFDPAGDRLGKVRDVVVIFRKSDPPRVIGLVVEIPGRRHVFLSIGRVTSIGFDDKMYQASVEIEMQQRYVFPKDSSLKILTAGLLGEQYLGIEPGASEQNLVAGATITQTQSAIVLETLISQFLYSKAADASDAPAAKP